MNHAFSHAFDLIRTHYLLPDSNAYVFRNVSNAGWQKVPENQADLLRMGSKQMESLFIPDPTANDLEYMVIGGNQYQRCEFKAGQNGSAMSEQCDSDKKELSDLLPCVTEEAIIEGIDKKQWYNNYLIWIVVGAIVVAFALMLVVCCVYCKFVRKAKAKPPPGKPKSVKDKESNATAATKKPSVSEQSEEPAKGGKSKSDNQTADIGKLEQDMKLALGAKGSKKGSQKSNQGEAAPDAPEEAAPAESVKSDQNTYNIQPLKAKKASKAPKDKGHYKENVKQFTHMVNSKPEKSKQNVGPEDTKLKEPSHTEETPPTNKSQTPTQTPDMSNFMKAGEQGTKSSVKSKTGDDKMRQLLSMEDSNSSKSTAKGADAKYKSLLKE